MNRFQILLCFLMIQPGFSQGANPENIAYVDNQIRFTLISEYAVRLEYAPDGRFIDDRSLLAVNRDYPHVDFRTHVSDQLVEVTTSALHIRYQKGTGRFSSRNLTISSTTSAPFQLDWHPGMRQKQNLKGTKCSLDGARGRVLQYKTPSGDKGDTIQLSDGLLARDGWTLLDDSNGYLFDLESRSITSRPNNEGQDWYFLAYGNNFKQALMDFSRFAGPIPLLPRAAYGNWWSRYWLYSDGELRKVVSDFETYSLPLDVLGIDMDWHHTTPGKGGWSAWNWNQALFPDHRKLLHDLKSKNLLIMPNLHLFGNIRPYDPPYRAMAEDLGIDPESECDIPWNSIYDKRFVDAFFKHQISAMADDGFDFWWIDEGGDSFLAPFDKIDRNLWTNFLFFSEPEHRGNRPICLARYGGLGSHRYPIGFSGDTFSDWETLDFIPEFQNTAANVLFGYWSHDIGGFQGESLDPELFVRWTQYQALTPCMRFHSAKQPKMDKSIWKQSHEFFIPLRKAIILHYELIPYIYTMGRIAYDKALAICRPLYYDYPDSEASYDFPNEYLFGDNLFVAPITHPRNKTRLSYPTFWMPDGMWYEWSSGSMIKGGKLVSRNFALDEYPLYIKAGAIVPMYDGSQRNLKANDEKIILVVAPSDKEGSAEFSLYEDNGSNPDYASQYASTRIFSQREANRATFTIEARKGFYNGMPSHRKFILKLLSAPIPKTVTINGKPGKYTFDGSNVALIVDIPETDCSREKKILIEFSQSQIRLDGLKGVANRLYDAIIDLKEQNDNYNYFLTEEMEQLWSVREQMIYHPEQLESIVSEFWMRYENLESVLKNQSLSPEETIRFRSFLE